MSRFVWPEGYGAALTDMPTMVPFQTLDGVLTPDPGVPLSEWTDVAQLAVDRLFTSQPSVRKVTGFIARHLASLPFHVYRRVDDNDRERVRDGAVAAVLAWPSTDPTETPFRFWESVVLDLLIFDRCAIEVVWTGDGPRLLRLPAHTWRAKTDRLHRVTKVEVIGPGGETTPRDPADFLLDVGYSPRAAGGGSPLESLRVPIDEWMKEAAYRAELYEGGPSFSGIVKRDKVWPNAEARTRFLTGLGSFRPGGARSGGTMLLEDGMEYDPVTGISPKDVSDVESRKLTDVEVASAYHVAPELVGAREGTFANLNAFRTMLWSVNLGPYITALEQMMGRLVPILEPDAAGLYLEAHVQAKLRGSFEEQAAQLQTSTGAPWMTRNEARARNNLPAVEGGDELITPLNVLVGGQASPTDSAPPKAAPALHELGAAVPYVNGTGKPVPVLTASQWAGVAAKADTLGGTDADREAFAALLRRHFDRQKVSITPLLEGGGDWWDADRWDTELAADLFDAAISLSSAVGMSTAIRLRGDARYSIGRTLAYLEKVMGARAKWINAATHEQLEAAKTAGEPPEQVFETAVNSRAVAGGAALVAAVGSFAQHEAAKQNVGSRATKTWVTRSNDPRDTHAAMNGQTVGIDEVFSNGMKWPGDAGGGADEVAGCQCGLIITPED